MNATDWQFCADTERLFRALSKLKYHASARKLRLFCVGCCRGVWHSLEEPMRRVIEVAERHADGAATTTELQTAHDHEMRRNRGQFDKQGILCRHGSEGPHGRVIARWAYQATEGTSRSPKPIVRKVCFAVEMCAQAAGRVTIADKAVQAAMFRDIIGNPYHSTLVDPAWLSPNVRALAQALYDEQSFDRMPILADALEEAGCTHDCTF